MEVFSADVNIIQIVVNVALGGAVCLTGIFFNIVNIIVFVKQGLGQTVNISLLAISVSDLGSLVFSVWVNINFNPFIEPADVPYEPWDIIYYTGVWPHACFLHITIWITVYVTAERFVCVALPLKVKRIFTPLRTKVVVSLIYSLMFLTIGSLYFYYESGKTLNPARNKTRFGLKKRVVTVDVDKLVFIMFVVLELVSFVTLTVVTCLLVVTLRRRLKWRQTATADRGQCQAVSTRGTRTMKMVGLVAGLLIVCAAPGLLLSLVEIPVYGFERGEKYNKTFIVFWSFAFLIKTLHTTVNTALFYKMSSKFKQHLDRLLFRCAARCHGNCIRK